MAPPAKEYRRRAAHYNEYQKQWAAKRRPHLRKLARQRHRATRERVLAKYGGKCVCCSISQYEFLAIDHVKGGGCKERRDKKFNNAQAFYNYLDKTRKLQRYQIVSA